MKFDIKTNIIQKLKDSCITPLQAFALPLVLIASGLLAEPANSQVPAGPGTWSSNQTWAADAAHGGNLQGYFYWPATQPVLNGKRALVLVLHGCAQTALNDVINSSADGGYNWKGVADQYGAVILAPNATGNVINHCWDYYGTNHSRNAGHPYVLLDLINRFKNNSQYAIDPDQVYVAGLSSGGGQVMVMGCLAPDVFAGIGNNAGPALGTSSTQYGSVPSGYTSTTAKNNCLALAGSNKDKFATQIANATWGAGALTDGMVATAYGPLNMEAMRLVYGGSYSSSSITVAGGGTGSQHTSNGKVRTSQITVAGLGHAWPSGSGGQNANYVKSTTIHYPQYLMNFWFTNNLRVGTVSTTTTTTGGGTTTTTASTTTTTVAGTCYTSANYYHVTGGRAYNSMGYAKANGSNQNMGLNNIYVVTKLRKTGTNYYVIDSTCP